MLGKLECDGGQTEDKDKDLLCSSVKLSILTFSQKNSRLRELKLAKNQNYVAIMMNSRRSVIFKHLGLLFALGIFLKITISWHSHYWTHTNDPRELANSNSSFVIYKANHTKSAVHSPGNNNAGTKQILLWTPMGLPLPNLSAWKIYPDTLANCPYKCNFTTNDNDLKSSHAVVFEKTSANVDFTIPSIHENLDQIWAVLRLEPLISLRASNDFTNFYENINWTIAYRRDSDVEWKAGRIIQKSDKSDLQEVSGQIQKGLIAWQNSDCTTSNHRQLYVNKLNKFIPVHNYGNCKPREGTCGPKCHESLGKKYKFLLVYETSFCVDFMRQEYYNALKYGMVPIIFEHSSFTRSTVPGSYINGNEFKTPEALANFIKFLDANRTEYVKYFEWRKQFAVLSEDEMLRENWCAVCTKLHTVDVKTVRKHYTNLTDWFLQSAKGEEECFVPMLTESAKEFFKLFQFD